MQLAIKQAIICQQRGEVPVGAVLIDCETDHVVAKSGNLTLTMSDPTAHAEINVIRDRCATLNSQRIPHHDLYVTLEPCAMCAAAIAHARIRRVYFGAYDPKGGGIEHGAKVFNHETCHHRPEIFGGIMEQECAALLKDFFTTKRD